MTAENPTRREKLLQWRDWSLPTKLAAIVLIPVILAVTLGIGQIRWQVGRAAEFGRVDDVLNAVDDVEPLLTDIQDERTNAVERLAGSSDAAAVRASIDKVDKSREQLRATFAEPGSFGPVVSDRYRELNEQLGKLDQLRTQVQNNETAPVDAIQGYSAMVDSVLSLDRALASTVADQRLSSNASALQDLLVMMEEVRLQQVWGVLGLTDGSLGQQGMQQLQSSNARLLKKIDEAGSTVSQHWKNRLDETVNAGPIVERNQLLTKILMEGSQAYDGSFSVGVQEWNQRSDDSIRLIDAGHKELGEQVRSTARQLQDEASNRAGWQSVLLLTTLLAAAWVVVLITRQLLRSLRRLRRGALESAEHELPEAVQRIRTGDRSSVHLEPVPVHNHDEVGQVARAFDEVNQQALRLAIEQATLRRGFNEAFISVSRRSQSLLEHQLRLFEELEQDEADPDQLSRLFQLDHLATRMRRNNENLMVLSGSDLVRRFTQPTEVGHVLRAAVSEIEQYPRVSVQPPPSVELRGHVASDLVRLFAELLDNAANFSSPDTSVTASVYQAGDGSVVVDVLDTGIGMGDQEIAEANRRLDRTEESDLTTSRRMGLFVVGRLAYRHGLDVRLHGGTDLEGVRAMVTVPDGHVVTHESVGPASSPWTAPPGHRNGHSTDLPTSGTLSPGSASAATEQHRPVSPTESSDSGVSTQFTTASSDASSDTGLSDTGAGTIHHDGAQASLSNLGGGAHHESRGLFDQAEKFATTEVDDNAAFSWPMETPLNGVSPVDEPHNGVSSPRNGAPNAPDVEAPTGRLFDAPLDVPPHQRPVSSDTTSDWSDGSELPHRTPRSARSENTGAQGEGEPIPEVSTDWFQPASENPRFQAQQQTQRDEWDTSTADGFAWPAEDDWPLESSDEIAADQLGSEDAPRNGRSAGDVSRRIADLHNGVQFGRGQNIDPESGPARPDQGTTARDTAESSGTDEPADTPEAAQQPMWSSAALDDAQRAAEAATNPDPSTFTGAGLPRRTPKAHLVPGSAQDSGTHQPDSTDAEQPPQQRDAEHLRSRLSNFQSGVRRGRHRAGDET